jgi:hypothetical protein
MAKWFKAFALGMQILTAIENVKAGQPAVLEVEWKGKMYRLSLSQTSL